MFALNAKTSYYLHHLQIITYKTPGQQTIETDFAKITAFVIKCAEQAAV